MTPNDAARAAAPAPLPQVNPAALQPMNTEMLEICQPIVQGMTQYSGALCDGYAAMGAEWLNFVNRRLHADMSLPGPVGKMCIAPACSSRVGGFHDHIGGRLPQRVRPVSRNEYGASQARHYSGPPEWPNSEVLAGTRPATAAVALSAFMVRLRQPAALAAAAW